MGTGPDAAEVRGGTTPTGTIRHKEPEPNGLLVPDAEATEEKDATLDFVVRLPGRGGGLTAEYASANDTATA